MADLGVLSVEADAAAEPDTFGWYGETIRTRAEVSELPFLDLLEDADAGKIDEDDPRAGLMLKQLFREYIDAEDFDRFWALARQHGQTTEDLMAVVYRILELKAQRTPTKPSSGSPPGSEHTAAKSKGGSSRKGSKSRSTRQPDLRKQAALRVIRGNLAAGRPDLALHVAESDLAQRPREAAG